MTEKEEYLRKLLSKEHFNKLLCFYAQFFKGLDCCIDFLYSILQYEPLTHKIEYINDGFFCLDANNIIIEDDVFIPKRMLNAVQRFVSVARDMEVIRPGKDPFKIIYLITCIESLQSMRSRTLKIQEFKTKRQMRNDFFLTFTSPDDVDYIIKHFERCPDDDENFCTRNESSLQIFVDALGDIRNAAVHNGECWELLFPTEIPGLIISIPSGKEYTKWNCYENSITYDMLEQIFVRTCIRFIQQYIREVHP